MAVLNGERMHDTMERLLPGFCLCRMYPEDL